MNELPWTDIFTSTWPTGEATTVELEHKPSGITSRSTDFNASTAMANAYEALCGAVGGLG